MSVGGVLVFEAGAGLEHAPPMNDRFARPSAGNGPSRGRSGRGKTREVGSWDLGVVEPRSSRRWSRSACWWPAAWSPPRSRATRRRCSPRATRPTSGIERKVDALLQQMTLEEKLQQVQLLSDGQITDADAQGRRRRRLQPRPTRRRSTTSSTSRWSSRGCTSRSCSPTTRSTATARSSRSRSARPAAFDPSVAHGRRHDRRARVGDGRHQADLQPDGRRLARAALGPDRRGRRRGPVPRLGDRRRPGQGRPGPRLLARPTRSSPASSTSPPTASPRAAATTTRPTCPSSGCATSTCRRSRPRSTPAPTR